MDKYINQLIEDLEATKRFAPKQKSQSEMSEEDFLAELEEIDRIIDEEPEVPMHEILGIDPMFFPPPEKLNKEQKKKLSEKILELWAAFRIGAVFPDDFPMDRLYPLLLKKIKEPFLYFPMGETWVEFCDYEPENCPFGNEYCTCEDFDDEDDLDMEKYSNDDPDALPF